MAVNLLTNVIIGGQTTAGFNALASKIQSLGAEIDRIGKYARDFEKESAQVYRNYEDNMLAAEYALSAQYDSASDLGKVMKNLDKYAQDWAASTIFHTDDVSKAIDQAAHAGWNYEKIIEGIPQAMYIAQAGNMDLSTGLDYLVKMMGATQTEFEKTGSVIDQWAMASNLSATNIDEMGEAFKSMGSAATFGDSTAELFTLLAMLADVGTVGNRAGTQLRSAMVRIVAPTTKAEAAMSLLGADADEINEALSDTNVTKAAKTLQGLGFSAYDSQGKLLPMIQIFSNLYDAMDGLEEQAQNEILTAIFPTRTIAAARAFMAAIGNGKMEKTFQAISNSEGYAAKGAKIMMSGMTGSIETLKSKWEEFKRSTGETLAPTIEKVADFLGGLVDKLNDLSPEQLAGLTSLLTTLGAAGPLLMGAGAVMKFVSVLGLGGTLAFAAGAGIAYFVGYLQKLNEQEFKGNFGDLELDLDTLGSHVSSLKSQFDKQLSAISTWEEGLEKAEQKYATTSSKLSETLLMDVLTGKELTKEDKDAIFNYADQIYSAVMDGIDNAKASDLTFLQSLFGDRSTEGEDVVYNTAANVVDQYYGGLYAEAYKVGETLRKQLTAALTDPNLDEAERQAIQASIDRLNEIEAQIASTRDKEAYYRQLYKAQSVSWDSVSDYASENQKKKDEKLDELEEAYGAKWAHYRAAFDDAIEHGTEFEDLHGNKKVVTEDDWADFEAQFNREKEAARQAVIDMYSDLTATAFDSLLNDSDMSVGWNYLKWMQQNGVSLYTTDENGMRKVNYEGMQLTPEIADALYQSFGNMTKSDINKLKKKLKPFSDNAQVAEFINMLDLIPDLDNFLVGYKDAQNTAASEEQKHLDTLLEQLEQLNDDEQYYKDILESGIYSPDSRKYRKAQEKLPEVQQQKAEIEVSIEAAEKEIERLKAEAGKDFTITVDTEVDDTAVKNYQPGTKTMRIIPFIVGHTYAEGGRATEPSIFGEAGAEWAIPEAHTDRTAELLNAARQASGFTWSDLISRFGGLNANPNHQSVVVNYSPTINATNADGVAGVLQKDKARLLKMVRDMLTDLSIRDDVEAYA